MIKLYDSRLSGNAWKIRLLLNHLKIPFQRETLVLAERKTYTPEFLAKNPQGKIPVVELDDGTALFESNAILTYFAEGTPLLPSDRLLRTRVLQWLFFEQAEVMLNLALPRFLIAIKKAKAENEQEIARRHAAGYAALTVMEGELARRPYMVGDSYTIADISLYPYAAMAHEGEYEMKRFPNVLAWFKRIEAQPGYVPLLED